MKTRIQNLFVVLVVFAGINSQLSTARAQGTAFTYQGRVTDNGTNFTGAGQFEFALVTSTNTSSTATATANAPSGGFITGYTVTYGGGGYVTPPNVTVSGGGGSGATATANISGGMVTSLTVGSTGNGNYGSAPTVTIDPPPINISYTTYWSNDGTSVNGNEPSAAVSVAVTNGLFTAALGDTTLANMTAIPAALFSAQSSLQLQIWFNDGVNGFAALSPVQNLTATPYAANAVFANTASNVSGTISASQLNSGVVSVPMAFVNSDSSFVGDGSGLKNLNPANFASGVVTVPMAFASENDSFSGAFTGNGANLTSLNASKLTSIGLGSGNFFLGSAGNATTTGSFNTGSGLNALASNTSGSDNTTTGSGALHANTTGNDNTGYGYNALHVNGVGSQNTAIGSGALFNNASGSNDIALGFNAGENITTSSSNIDIGNEGLATDTNIIRIGSGQSQTFIAGTINGDGGGLTNLDASQLASGVIPTNVLPSFQGPNYNTIGGGHFNTASGSGTTVGGGSDNAANSFYSTVGGGNNNIASGEYSTIGGGVDNQAINFYATVPGGENNTASGEYSFAAGYGANATNTGAFVWSDGTGTFTTSTNNNSVTMRASGGYRFFTGTANTTYAYLAPGSGSWTSMSDRNVKENFQSINPLDVLDRVAALPVDTWNYKTQPAAIRHIGPTAQDFKAAFSVGETDTGISVVDEGGVALAAIQGLNQKLQDELNRQGAENAKLKQQNDSLARQLNELETEVKAIEQKK
ncbi:MAG TPA: tail fiber domain-containing protein [Verrucomicrobiae bacterium]|jgi:hypothetical protein